MLTENSRLTGSVSVRRGRGLDTPKRHAGPEIYGQAQPEFLWK